MPILNGLAGQIIYWTIYFCNIYHVDPAFALAVAHVESRIGQQEFRAGLIGRNRYYAPYAIHRDYIKRWPDVDTIKGNCEAGVRALRGSNYRAILRRYNKSYTAAYGSQVDKAIKKYRARLKEEGWTISTK